MGEPSPRRIRVETIPCLTQPQVIVAVTVCATVFDFLLETVTLIRHTPLDTPRTRPEEILHLVKDDLRTWPLIMEPELAVIPTL